MNKLLRTLASAGLVLLAISGSAQAADAAQAPGTTCRRMVSGSEAGKTFCGTSEQWAEFDRRVALFNADAACRELLGAEGTESCFDAENGPRSERRVSLGPEGLQASDESRQAAAVQTYQVEQMQQVQTLVDQAQAALPQ
jgi:hypothetical protein